MLPGANHVSVSRSLVGLAGAGLVSPSNESPLPGGSPRGRAGLGEAQGLPLAQMGKLEEFYEISPKIYGIHGIS